MIQDNKDVTIEVDCGCLHLGKTHEELYLFRFCSHWIHTVSVVVSISLTSTPLCDVTVLCSV